jgi:hypothetical protein
MIGLRSQAGALFVEANREFTFSGGPLWGDGDTAGNNAPTVWRIPTARASTDANLGPASQESTQTLYRAPRKIQTELD